LGEFLILSKKQITLILPLIFLILAILFSGLPYGFYTFLRLIVSISAIYYVWLIKDENKNWIAALFIVIATLFNPIIPIHLTRQIWFIVDIVVASFYSCNIFIASYVKV